jgi:acyl-CoA synthetase (NDP forming)
MATIAENLELLKRAGLQIVPYALVTSSTQAIAEAQKLGYPVVLKLASDIHKTDVGGVITNIHDNNDLARAWQQITDNLNRNKIGFQELMLQKQVSGVELIAGLKQDPVFEQVILVGSGGIFTEVERDVSFRVCPITEYDAKHMINEIRARKLLRGARGKKPANVAKLQEALVKLSHLSDIKELDVNPLIVDSKNAWVVDARIIS